MRTAKEAPRAPLMWLIAGLNTAVFAATLTASAFGTDLIGALSLHAASPQALQALSYMFTHAGLLHFIVNMLVLIAYGTFASTIGLGRAVAPLYLAGGLAGGAVFVLTASAGSILAGASASVLALVAAMTVWGGKIRVAVPLAGRPPLGGVSALIIAVALLSAASSGASGALFAHLGGLSAGLIAACALRRYGRTTVAAWLLLHRGLGEIRRRVLDKAESSGYESLTDAEKKLL